MPWVSAAQLGGELGPFGGTEHGDGETWMLSYQANGVAGAVEAIEADVPAVVLREEPVPDSGGAGRQSRRRGGAARLAVARGRRAQSDVAALQASGGLRRRRRPATGRNGGVWVWPPAGAAPAIPATGPDAYRTATPLAGLLDPETGAPDPAGEFLYPYRQPSRHTDPLSVLRYINRGGGGWGDPLRRDPHSVLIDVRDGYVTIAGAARDYGVVVVGDPDEDPEGLQIDAEATVALRAQRGDGRQAR